jgi:mRNA-degrading endonuclease YafQ of YafQ-DinJ toxin-antitoxin module
MADKEVNSQYINSNETIIKHINRKVKQVKDMKNNYKWEYGESEYQKYYECKIGNDVILLFANKYEGHNDKMFMATIIQDGKSFTLMDKTYNDSQRKKFSNRKETWMLPSVRILGSKDIDYMKHKAIYCYEHNQQEISA